MRSTAESANTRNFADRFIGGGKQAVGVFNSNEIQIFLKTSSGYGLEIS